MSTTNPVTRPREETGSGAFFLREGRLTHTTTVSQEETGSGAFYYWSEKGSGAFFSYCPYDPLNRVTCKNYSDGTPTANFGYDETSVTLGSWTSPGLNYTKGRLTHTTSTGGGATLTATVQDYDKMGRTADYWQCTPVNCGGANIWERKRGQVPLFCRSRRSG